MGPFLSFRRLAVNLAVFGKCRHSEVTEFAPMELRRFEMKRLYETLDRARLDRGLTWAELVAEINIAFEGTPSIPISVGTVRGMEEKQSVTSAVVLQVLRWLGRTPESFLAGNIETVPSEFLPSAGRGRVLRFDTRLIHAELNIERQRRDMDWKQVARELPGFSESMLTNLANGPLIGFPRVMLLTQWVGRPAAHFVRVHTR